MSLTVLPFHLLPVSFGQSSSHYDGTAVTLGIFPPFILHIILLDS